MGSCTVLVNLENYHKTELNTLFIKLKCNTIITIESKKQFYIQCIVNILIHRFVIDLMAIHTRIILVSNLNNCLIYNKYRYSFHLIQDMNQNYTYSITDVTSQFLKGFMVLKYYVLRILRPRKYNYKEYITITVDVLSDELISIY